MTGLLVPVAVIVVGHDRDPVQVAGNAGHVVAYVHDLLAGGDGGRQEEAAGPESLLELAHPGREGVLVAVPRLFALGLHICNWRLH